MKAKLRAMFHGFTLVELLVTMGVIAIVAAMLIGSIRFALVRGQKTRAQTDLANIVGAINAYFAEYGVYPTPDTNGRSDHTFGGKGHNGTPLKFNREVMDILRDRDSASNPGHVNNKRRIVFIQVSPSSMVAPGPPPDTDSENNTYSEAEGFYLDPWLNPYVICMDTDFDGEIGISGLEGSSASVFTNVPNVVDVWASGAVIPSVTAGALSYGPDAFSPQSVLFSWGQK